MLGAPPDLVNEARTVLENALSRALVDPELEAWSLSTGLPLAPLSAEDTAANVSDQRELYAQYRDLLL
jgi:tripartite-type tricarboxylate transporter receptor subunit TctC